MSGQNFNRYTIDGETYLVHNGTLFQPSGDQYSIGRIESEPYEQLYLYEEKLVHIEAGYSSIKLINPDVPDAVDFVEYNEFDGAEPVESLVPDHLVECPDCGTAAGRKDDPEGQCCIVCGWESEAFAHSSDRSNSGSNV